MPEELASDPSNRLRLTLGLRKQDGRWVVAHEHHSFPDKTSQIAIPDPSLVRPRRFEDEQLIVSVF
jgi:hypothetical protein